MKELLNQITPVLTTTLITVLVAVIGYIGKEVVKVVPKVIEHLISKIGLSKYNQSKAFAKDTWFIVEEYFRLHPEAKEKIMSKAEMFTLELRKKLPMITDEEIKTLRQAVAGEINKDKDPIIKALEPQVQEVPITPIIKYVTADGIELQPISAATQTPVQ